MKTKKFISTTFFLLTYLKILHLLNRAKNIFNEVNNIAEILFSFSLYLDKKLDGYSF